MAFPKKIKKSLPLEPKKILSPRREELLEYINEDGTYLPKSILHEDLDRGFLEFVKNELETTVSGKLIPTIDLIITTQNWAQFTETWSFSDLDDNINPPFISIVRQPEVKYGSNPALTYTIPNRKNYYYAKVPTWDGNRKGADVYKIPQPVPVDITYNVKIFCNRMKELNMFNKNVLQKFSSRQSYTFVKGHYIPIILENTSNESSLDLDKRKYYIQDYTFNMMGFLIDEEEFEVKPAINRILQVYELDEGGSKKKKEEVLNIKDTTFDLSFLNNNKSLSQNFDFTCDLTFLKTENIQSYSVYINNELFGTDVSKVFVKTNDTVRFTITKNMEFKDSYMVVKTEIV